MWKNAIILMALGGASMCGLLAMRSTEHQPVPLPFKAPPMNPFNQSIAGAGIVEAASENVVIGVNDAGRVAKIFVHKGQNVKSGDPLLQTDTSNLEASRVAAAAAVDTADEALKRTIAYQRPETGVSLRAQLAQAKALKGEAEQAIAEAHLSVPQQEWQIKDQDDQVKRMEVTVKANAEAEVDLVHAKFVLEEQRAALELLKQKVFTAQAHLETAVAGVQIADSNLQTYLAGAWGPDVDNARVVVAEAKARLKQIDLQIERCTVRAPIDAVVLRCEIREGEYAMAIDPTADADNVGIVLGNLDDIHVRVDIDEYDAQRFQSSMPAVALFKSGEHAPIPLDFVRVEPFVIPKRALTNSQTELVDTRVLQVIFKVRDPKIKLYVGQQLDVYFDAKNQQALN